MGMEIDSNSSGSSNSPPSIFMKIYRDLLLQPSAEHPKHTASAFAMARRSLFDAAVMSILTGIAKTGDIPNTFRSLRAIARTRADAMPLRAKITAGFSILRQSPSARCGAFFGALALVSDASRVALDRFRGRSSDRVVWEDVAINATATSLLLARRGPLDAIMVGLGFGAIDASFYALFLNLDRHLLPKDP